MISGAAALAIDKVNDDKNLLRGIVVGGWSTAGPTLAAHICATAPGTDSVFRLGCREKTHVQHTLCLYSVPSPSPFPGLGKTDNRGGANTTCSLA